MEYDRGSGTIGYNQRTLNGDGTKSDAWVVDYALTRQLRNEQFKVDLAGSIGLGVMFAPITALAGLEAAPSVATFGLVNAGRISTGTGVVGEIITGVPLTVSAAGTGAAALRAAEAAGGIRTAEGIAYNGLTGPGPLGNAAFTFRSASYTQKTLDAELLLYRAYGGKAGKLSPYWSRVEPSGPLQARLDSALLPEWGNTASQISVIRVPARTTIYEGAVAPQSTSTLFLPGGGNQVYIPKVDPKWLVGR